MEAKCRAPSAVLIDCVSTGRSPTVRELDGLAERIWIELGKGRSAFAWGTMQPSSCERLVALRVGLVSTKGNGG